MTLILSGTDGLSDVDGSAATPAIRGTDANTGIFFPAADTIAFSEGGVESMRIDSSGNVGIGTSSPEAPLHVAKSASGGDGGYLYLDNPAASTLNNKAGIRFATSNGGSFASTPTGEITNVITDASSAASALTFGTFNGSSSGERMRIDSSGNVGIGTSSPTGGASRVVDVYGSGSSAINFHNATSGTTATDGGLVGQYGSDLVLYNYEAGIIQFGTSNTERMRITAGGDLLVGTSSSTWLGSLLKSGGTITLASGASINLSSAVCGGAIVSVYVVGSGNGGLFYLNYSAVAAKITGDGTATDTGSDFAVYKSAASHTSTLKNKSVSTQTFSVVVVAGQLS